MVRYGLGSLKPCTECPRILTFPGERDLDTPKSQPTASHRFVNTPPPPSGGFSTSSEESRGEAGGSTGVWPNWTAGSSQPFLSPGGGRPEEGKQVEGRLPEGTAAVPKGTELNMSALAGSVCDEDGIKASPGVAGVCQTERGRGRVRLLGDLAQHSSRMGGSRCRKEGVGVLPKPAAVQATDVVGSP